MTTRPTLSLTVLSPDGKPAVGALAVLVPPGRVAEVTDGQKFDDDPAYVRAIADGAGLLKFSDPPGRFLLVIIHATGSGQWNQDSIRSADRVMLSVWGSIKGRRLIGNLPGAGRKIIVFASRGVSTTGEYDPHVPTAIFIRHLTTDSAGDYRCDRMSPGEVNIAADDPMSWGGIERPLHVVNVKSGQTTVANIGGHGRVVVGRVLLPSELSARHDWAYWFCSAFPKAERATAPMPKELQQQPITKQIAWWAAFDKSPAAADCDAAQQEKNVRNWAGTYPFDIQADQKFKIEDVDPGTYRISFEVLTKKVDGIPRLKLAKGQAEFTVDAVADGASDKPLELPPIPVELLTDVRIGDVAPDFDAAGLDDQPIQLCKFRGKYVLLEFWATWCGPCVAETDSLKAVYDRFGSDKRFAMISLSSDKSPDRPARFAAAHGLAWHQGYLGGEWDSPIEALYHVDGIPSIWLIGPDGKVLLKNLRGDNLPAVIGQALSE